MDLGLNEKSVVVLASSKGLGRAAALSLARERAKVAICARNEQALKATAEELKTAKAADVYYEVVDVQKAEQLAVFMNHVLKKWGRIDILVTNAGGPPVKSFDETNEEEWHYWFDVTFMSVVRAVRLALPSMKEQHWGRIINITSISVKKPIENLIYSNALRLAVVGLAKTLSQELGPFGITVNNVAPGHHLTEGLERIITRKVSAGMSRKEVLDGWTSHTPMRRLGQPDDLAGLITYLASEPAGFITGTTIQVDGGQYPGSL